MLRPTVPICDLGSDLVDPPHPGFTAPPSIAELTWRPGSSAPPRPQRGSHAGRIAKHQHWSSITVYITNSAGFSIQPHLEKKQMWQWNSLIYVFCNRTYAKSALLLYEGHYFKNPTAPLLFSHHFPFSSKHKVYPASVDFENDSHMRPDLSQILSFKCWATVFFSTTNIWQHVKRTAAHSCPRKD